jgi:N-acetyl sugar amidotransferase
MDTHYKICTKCIMDSSVGDITFDDDGICCYCRKCGEIYETLPRSDNEANERLKTISNLIKRNGKNQKYNCLIGLSGGVDSSFVAYLAKKLGLKPLAVHLDNGWNSEIAVDNVRKIVDKLQIDLFTYVIDWEEFKDLQRSFFKASVVDIEILTDHAITAALFNIAGQHKIKYILSGSNIATESGMPPSWSWRKQDLTNIIGIHKKFGTVRIRSFPTFTTWQQVINNRMGKHKLVRLLDNVVFKKIRAMETLKKEVGWRYYGDKHYESVFTKFYQAYVLPAKFGIDKRKAHLSSLIRNGEISRSEALQEMKRPPYDHAVLSSEKEYVLKKLGFGEDEFEEIMARPPRSHMDYATDERLFRFLNAISRAAKKCCHLTGRRCAITVGER